MRVSLEEGGFEHECGNDVPESARRREPGVIVEPKIVTEEKETSRGQDVVRLE